MKKFLGMLILIISITAFGKQVAVPQYVNGPNGVVTVYNYKTGEVLNGEHELIKREHWGEYVQTKGNFKDGLYNGKIYFYSTLGKILEVAEYKNGIKNGKSEGVEYDLKRDSVYILSCNYRDGKKEGKVTRYYTSFGKLNKLSATEKLNTEGYEGIKEGKFEEQFYKNDVLNGPAKQWYRSGKLKEEGNYKNGQPEGLIKGWYENGQIKAEVNCKNGQLEGLMKEWYENGQIKGERNFKNGQLEGLVKEWYENGQIKGEVNCKNGQPEGLRKEWYENGQIQAETNFKNGQPEGLMKLWYKNGQIQLEGNHKNGQPEGLAKLWYENGQIQAEKIFKNGQLIEAKRYDENGNLK